MTSFATTSKTYQSRARRWLGSADGIEFGETETVDVTKAVDGTHYDSTTTYKLYDGLHMVFDPADTTVVVPADVEPTGDFAGVLFTATDISAGESVVGVGLLQRGVVLEDKLPLAVPAAVKAQAQAQGVRYRQS